MRSNLASSLPRPQKAEDRTLLTVDLDLYLAATRHGQKAINFNHHIEANRPPT